MEMFDTLSIRRWYPLLLTSLAVAISGCATTMGLGETAVRDGPQGTPGTNGRARGVGNRTLRPERLRRGGGASQQGGEPRPEAGGRPALPRTGLSSARRRRFFRGASPRVP